MGKKIEIEFAGRPLSIETEKMATQSDASVLLRYGDTVVLVAVVSKPSEEIRDFLPLLVEYREQAYAAGKIPGGYFKREGRPREREILYGRAIDRALRPRFPKGFTDEVEVVAFLLSYDMQNEGNILGIIGASAALHVSGIPFMGPVGAVRVGFLDGKILVNPTNSEIEKSEMDLLVAGSSGEITMVELAGKEVSEELIVKAVEEALPYIDTLCELQESLRESSGIEKSELKEIEFPEGLKEEVRKKASVEIDHIMRIPEKKTRNEALELLHKKVKENLKEAFPEKEAEIELILFELEREKMRKMVVEEGRRIDGRGFDEVRHLSMEIGILPRTHGSALFRRGETQALVVTTLGTSEDVQRLSELEPEESKRFMLHYNFPPISTGELRPLKGPSRREIGHGALAEKALLPLIPDEDKFPYTIRVVSDILESNGSTSMATVCGASLSLMDAGVPILSSCAGVSVGLVKEEEKEILLTDIIGAEDHYGDMDFKVAGTRKGVTAIQMDLKVHGISPSLMELALKKAREARNFILDAMDATIKEPRRELSKFAPKVTVMTVPKEKIGEIIGPGGRVIRKIIETTSTKIDIDDNVGRVTISGEDVESVEEAKRMIEELVQEVELDKVYMGKVTKVASFGAFVEIFPGKEGLVHISELSNTRVKKVEDVVKVGDKILVKVIGIDDYGRIRLSRKAALSSGIKKVSKVD